MQKSFLLAVFLCLLVIPIAVSSLTRKDLIAVNSYSWQPRVTSQRTEPIDLPVTLNIPSIKLSAPILPVGVNEKGEMDVPSGKSRNVGWYAPGTLPGKQGSAVIDAHVFAAFSKLEEVAVGSYITVQTEGGKALKFIVTEATVYKLADVPLRRVFADAKGKYLNLITCAGKLLPDGSTYDHRLVVYAQLVSQG